MKTQSTKKRKRQKYTINDVDICTTKWALPLIKDWVKRQKLKLISNEKEHIGPLNTEIGSGVFGTVYLTTYKGEHVALKRMFISTFVKRICEDLRFEILEGIRIGDTNVLIDEAERLFEEILDLTLTQLKTEVNILKRASRKCEQFSVRFIEALIDSNEIYLIMEHCEMSLQDLFDKMKRLNQMFEPNHAEAIKSKLIAGLNCLHKNDIVLRDLHYGNILMRDKYTPVFADYGLSCYPYSNECADMYIPGSGYRRKDEDEDEKETDRNNLSLILESIDNYTVNLRVEV